MLQKRLALPLPLPFAALVLLALAYALPGLLGHDPWKTDDAIGAGIVHQMLRHGEWLVPSLAGEPFVEDGPLYYWLGAAFAWLASPVLELHNAARLASAVFALLAFTFVRLAARELYGRAEGDAAMLALLGSVGLLIHAHENVGEIGVLAAHALALYALALARRSSLKAGALLGVAWATALLCKGLGAALVPLLAALIVPLACRDWRTRGYAAALALGTLICASVSLAWLWTAHAYAPAALVQWLNYQVNALAEPTRAAVADYVVELSWAAWPAWPIALWVLWVWRRRVLEASVAMPLAALASASAFVAMTPDYREVNLLTLLPPLALLAGAGVPLLRRGAANALAWFGGMTFGFFGFLVWLGWFAMMTGVPAQIARNFAKLEPGHQPQFHWWGFAVAAVITLAWLFVLLRSDRSPFRSVTFWAAGVTLLWGLIMTLWIGWIDYGKTYRPVALALKRALPQGTRCVESRNLGEAQRAAFDYHAGIVTLRAELHPRGRCPVLLVKARPGDDDRALSPQWRRIWEGNRPRDKERYRLYVRRQ